MKRDSLRSLWILLASWVEGLQGLGSLQLLKESKRMLQESLRTIPKTEWPKEWVFIEDGFELLDIFRFQKMPKWYAQNDTPKKIPKIMKTENLTITLSSNIVLFHEFVGASYSTRVDFLWTEFHMNLKRWETFMSVWFFFLLSLWSSCSRSLMCSRNLSFNWRRFSPIYRMIFTA